MAGRWSLRARRRGISIAAAASVLALAAAVSGATAGTAARGTGAPVPVGVLQGITGDYGPYTPTDLVADKIAVSEINKAGGVLGRPLDLVIQDNKSTVEGAVSGYAKLVDVNHVKAIFGQESDAAVANLTRLAEDKIPAMCPQCGTTELDKKGGKWIWRLAASDTDNGIIAAQYAHEQGYKKVSILAENKEGTLSPALVFKEVFTKKLGGQVCADVRFEGGKSSYQAEVQKAFACKPDAVYMAAGFEAGVPILQEWARRGYGGKFIFSPDLLISEVTKATSAINKPGVAVGPIAGQVTNTPAYKAFEPVFKQQTGGKEPSAALGEAWAYDQIVLWALAAEAAKSVDGAKVAAKVLSVSNPPGVKCYRFTTCRALLRQGKEINYEGASTSLDMNKYGNLLAPPMVLVTIQDGKWVNYKNLTLDPKLRP